MTRIVEVILTDHCVGRGTTDDVCRTVYELWTKDGRCLARSDVGPTGGRLNNGDHFVFPEVIRAL